MAFNALLIINSGSSSIKFAVFKAGQNPQLVIEGRIERMGMSGCAMTLGAPDGTSHWRRVISPPARREVISVFIDWVRGYTEGTFTAVGHRVVHGGPKYTSHMRIRQQVLNELERLKGIDPEHLPQEIELIEEIRRHFPGLPQVACFDTVFHQDLPLEAKLLPIPRRYYKKGIRRFGFHGLSYTYVMSELKRIKDHAAVKGKMIVVHLGNGASMTAIRNGRPIDTSMGFTPTGGLPMGTRSGDLDPGLIEYVMRMERMDLNGLRTLVNAKSGLLGMSDVSADMRDLIKRAHNNKKAAEAIAVYCYHVKKWLGAYSAALGGIDEVVFTGGIGANAPEIRGRVCDGLEYLGIRIDRRKNANNAAVISSGSEVLVRVIPTREELVMARIVCHVMGQEVCS